MAASSRRFFLPDKKILAILAFISNMFVATKQKQGNSHWLGFLLNTTPDENRDFSFFFGK